ncbi:hypothetical protein ROU88_08105 [Macrococcus capreoli]
MKKLHVYLLPLSIAIVLLLLATPIGEAVNIAFTLIALITLLIGLSLYSINLQRNEDSNKTLEILREINKNQVTTIKLFEEQETLNKEMKELITSQVQEVNNNLQLIDSNLDNLMDNQLQELLDNQSTFFNEVNGIDKTLLDHSEQMEDNIEDMKTVIEDSFKQLEENNDNNHNILIDNLQKHSDMYKKMIEVLDRQVNNYKNVSNNFDTNLENLITLLSNAEDFNDRISKNYSIYEKNNHELLNEIKKIQEALIQSTSELADSKSEERKYLLKLQKELINKYNT